MKDWWNRKSNSVRVSEVELLRSGAEMDFPVKFDEEVEDGEIGPVDDYDPAFEYPGDNKVSQYPPQPRRSSSPPPATNRTTIFRLVVLCSTVLARSRRVAVLDGHTQVSIGRDVATSARVRLKEMAVSKFHASIYWDGSRREWGIVDMGSVHGTFVRSARHPSTSATASQRTPGSRLSEPRKASLPKILKHFDEITIGGTTFLVHEHHTGRPCGECTIEGEAEIPLFASRTSSGTSSVSRDEQSLKRKYASTSGEPDAKMTIAKLKSSLLSRHASPSHSLSLPNTGYKDRSARRRELHPEPRVQSLATPARPEPQPDPVPAPHISPSPSSPPPPVPSSNIGHKLLLLQGWNPGTALGEDPNNGLLEPLNVPANSFRAGLGSAGQVTHLPSQTPEDWKEEAKRRRWDGISGK